MGREEVDGWLREHHLPTTEVLQLAQVTDFLKAQWVLLLLLTMGFMALLTAVLVAWPALAFLASKLME